MRTWRLMLATSLAALALLAPGASRADVWDLGEDPAGDWGEDEGAEFAPIGDALGQDIIGAAIDTSDAGMAKFVIKLTSLPEAGGMPEVSRYTWDMLVNGKFVELDGKYSNYSRGSCDPTSGKCGATVENLEGDPTVITVRKPRDPGPQPFFVRGDCSTTPGNVTTCVEKGLVQGIFDPVAATVTIPVSLALLGVTEGCASIAPGANIFGGSISATPSAYFTSSAMPMDWMIIDPDLDPVIAC